MKRKLNPHRRDVLKLLAGFNAAATPAGASAVPTGKPSPPPLDGELRFDEEARAATAGDFEYIVRKAPLGVLLPGLH